MPRRLLAWSWDLAARALVGFLTPLARRLCLRIVVADLDRMGDTCAQLSGRVKARELGWIGREPTIFIRQPGRRIGNPCLIRYWQGDVRIETRGLLYPFLFRLAANGLRSPALRLRLPNGVEARGVELTQTIERAWEEAGREPLLALSEGHRKRGWDCLESLGCERDSWFVCVHAREPGWLGERPDSEHRHSNADIVTYVPAIQEVTRRGGWVIRMGDASMKPLAPMTRVIDYAHRPGRTDWMDVFLASECRFFLGSTSGLFALPWLFGVPVALANWVPMSDRPWSSRDLFIPKLYRVAATKEVLPFSAGFEPNLRHAGHVSPLVDAGVEVVDSTPEEIRELAVEMLDRLAGTWQDASGEEERRARYDSLASFYPGGVTARPGAAFLRRYEQLLP